MRECAQSLLRDEGCAAALPTGCRRQPHLLHGSGGGREARRVAAGDAGGLRNVSRDPSEAGAAGAASCRSVLHGLWTTVLAALALALPSAMAQTAYKYRDANGQWVFTDQAPASAGSGDSFNIRHENSTLHISVDRIDDAESTQLLAINDCLCIITIQASIVQSGLAAVPDGTEHRDTLKPGTQESMGRVPRPGTDKPALRYA